MNKRCSTLIISILSIFVCIISPAIVHPESAPKTGSNIFTSGKVAIDSDSWDLDNKNRIMVWSGKVHVTNSDLTIDCERLEIYYKESPEKDKTEKNQLEIGAIDNGRIDRIVVNGDVKITRVHGSAATAEKVVYTSSDEKIILTGNPAVISQNNSFIKGPKIIYDRKNDKYSAESSGSSKTNVVIFPKELKVKSIAP